MPTSHRFEPSAIKNKQKREEIFNKAKKEKRQAKLQRRLSIAKREADDPKAKQKRLEENQPAAEAATDIASDPFAPYFSSTDDPTIPPKVLITTSPKATRAEFHRRPKTRGFEMGKIASWAAGRGFSNLVVVNENMKKQNAITLVHLPDGPTAYFRLTSVELTKKIFGHARETPHHPELVLNNFVTRLGHTIGRMFQTFFPPLPEFQGRQVVTLHNQRDFLFFRRHRYAFRSTEKVALQEIGPRFTLKLRSLKKGLPSVNYMGDVAKPLEFDSFSEPEDKTIRAADVQGELGHEDPAEAPDFSKAAPPKADEYEWVWKPELETSRRTFFM
ncbi:anticodon-binding protein [Multifurca ochricompacta]|uniref:Anticodon-binding protein n=1 Tax=Multifurca ochricompacta TaxID=376703 RepID=A0AAD4QRC6_9AGAM|nr:anticodon-binding protein [Multifurca ochricompacta]